MTSLAIKRLALLTLALAVFDAGAAAALDCRRQTQTELDRLAVPAAAVDSIRYVEKYNPADTGPDVLGVRAWVRLQSCESGYLVVDMTRSCFVRQSYTRGACRWPNVTAY